MKRLWRYLFRAAIGLAVVGAALLVNSYFEREAKERSEIAATVAAVQEKHRTRWESLGVTTLRDLMRGLRMDDTVGIQKRLSGGSRVLICNPTVLSTFLEDDGRTIVAEVVTMPSTSGAASLRLKWLLKITNENSSLAASKPLKRVNGCIVVDIREMPTVKSDTGKLSSHMDLRGVTSGEIYKFDEAPDRFP